MGGCWPGWPGLAVVHRAFQRGEERFTVGVVEADAASALVGLRIMQQEPEIGRRFVTTALLVDVDQVDLVRGRRDGARGAVTLGQYVNDRPYSASSFLSTAIGKAFGTAMTGRSKERPERAATPVPVVARISALPCRGGEVILRRLFEPLGYDTQPLSFHWT